MNLIEKINAISKESHNQFKPDLAKYGKNFRAISDSAVLDVLNPLFEKYNVSYAVYIKDKNLRVEHVKSGVDVSGNVVEKLVFIADAHVCLDIRTFESNEQSYTESITFEGWGSGIDSGDKATGKAITAAVKYALFKGFRLRYSDDPDAAVSEDIENIAKPASKEKEPSKKKTTKKEDVVLATENQLNYIKGLCVDLNISDEDFKKKYKYLPYDKDMPMEKARKIITELKAQQDDDIPF